MRFVGLALIILSFPLFLTWLRSRPQHRGYALTLIVFMLFLAGRPLQVDAALVTWPLWNGTVRGIQLSLVDTLALAIIATRRSGVDRLAFLPLLGFYLVTLTLSIVNASVPLASVFSCYQWSRAILLFVALGGELTRARALQSLISGLSLGLLLQAGFVVWQKLSGVVQATGTLGHQNILGVIAELAVIPLLAAVLEGDRRRLTAAGLVAGLVIVASGGSRGAMAMVGVALVVLVILSLARRFTPHKLKVLGFGVLAMSLVLPIGLYTLEERFGDTPFTAEEDQRAAFERAARAMAADHPFGVGANLFVSVNNLQGYAAEAGVAWNFANRSAPVHNAYLLARAETGWAGQIAFMSLFLIPVFAALALGFSDRRSFANGVVLGSGIAIAAVGVHNLYEFVVHTYHPQALLIVNLAIIAGHVRAKRLAAHPARVRRSGEGAAIPRSSGGRARPAPHFRASRSGNAEDEPRETQSAGEYTHPRWRNG